MITNPSRPTILIVDDELSIRESFNLILEDKYNIILAASGEAALKKLTDNKIDVVYLDVRMPGMDGIETLKRMRQIDKDAVVTMVTAVNEVQKASEAIKLGAEDYLIKPFDISEILERTSTVIRKKGLISEGKLIRKDLASSETAVIGTSKRIEEINAAIEENSSSDSSVLITGEPGTEKATIARIIHMSSKRAHMDMLFYSVPLMEKDRVREDLFGASHGASAHTLKKKKGLLERASGGTLFIENIEFLPDDCQAALLDAIKKKSISREEGTLPIPIDVRIICAASTELKDTADSGKYNKALYEFISVMTLDVPPLRERTSDIPVIASALIEKFSRVHGVKSVTLSPDAIETLSGYSFPWNFDELEELIERIVLASEKDPATTMSLPFRVLAHSRTFKSTSEGKSFTYNALHDGVEKKYLDSMLAAHGSDYDSASKVLGISPSVIKSKLGM